MQTQSTSSSAMAQRARYDAQIAARKKTFADQLKLAPIPISTKAREICPTADLSGAWLDNYEGCGRGIAYVQDGKLCAWHYGAHMPTAWWDYVSVLGFTAKQVQLSCTQVCFL